MGINKEPERLIIPCNDSGGDCPYRLREAGTGGAIDSIYAFHILSMTKYSLHSKSEIALELAMRDELIARLQSQLEDAIDILNKRKAMDEIHEALQLLTAETHNEH